MTKASFLKFHVTPTVLLGLSLLAAPCAEAAKVLEPRLSTVKPTTPELDEETPVQRLVVKFHEGTRVRLRGGVMQILSEERDSDERGRMQRHHITDVRLNTDVSELQRVVQSRARGRRPERLFREPESTLAARKRLAEELSGKEMADLDLYYELPLEPGMQAADVNELVMQLNALDSVEIAYAEPVSWTASVSAWDARGNATASYELKQGYLDAAPSGIDARYAWSVPGGRGQGVRLIDVEGAWNSRHEDLPAFFYWGGEQFQGVDWRDHGTAVMGVMVGQDNGYGITGIANGASAGHQGIATQSMASAIQHAARAAGRGGVVLVELQAPGPRTQKGCACNLSQCNYVPLEYWRANFDAIAQATARGVHVVEAAGNGGADLDDPAYHGAFNRAVRDSGAILVGASSATGRVPMCWTNHGSRVDVHSWGEKVVTLGYGDLSGLGENRGYTDSFNGTSSAAPIVAGAVAAIQGAAFAAGKGPVPPREMRALLRTTGTPQAPSSKNIGPQPNLRRALQQVLSR
ncbi:S8 family serine peptidase [Cystobacter fuscus]|uniref:S8 family peptidase n=1 Tax=Cystobacter fuscus TaxID=43 RepID=UPI002B2F5437|nr:S8 family serine peptidase [Cystobacter fuscus]